MEIYQLRAFITVSRERHLTRAAERLHVSQPAVSGQIKSLETELGLTLFERHHGGMELTAAGAMLLQYAASVLASVDEMTTVARTLTGKVVGRISIGTILNPSVIRLGEMINEILLKHPSLEIDISHRNSYKVLQGIRQHELDAGFWLGDEVPVDLLSLKLRPLQYVVVAARSWADRISDASWDTIAAMPWVTTSREGSFYQLVQSMLRQQGQQPKTVVEADQESTIISLVQSGVGISLVREEVAAAASVSGELVIWEKGRATTMLQLIYLQSRQTSLVTTAILRAAEKIWCLPICLR
ncbi:LysR Transcriptional regulator [Burkholderiaceae bacterium]